tara:strand:+ start:500 stop:1336 length:837 start_codon:yes stop_codon:yes gene_type:complete
MHTNSLNNFLLKDKVIIVTGGAGLLGRMHAEAILDAEGIPVILDVDDNKISESKKVIEKKYSKKIFALNCDITNKDSVKICLDKIIKLTNRLDGLINNAAIDPKVGNSLNSQNLNRFEDFSLDIWLNELNVGLTGAFICSQIFGEYMATQKKGVIVNISSDLSIISPDQRLYEKEGVAENLQPVKPVTYSVIKTGLIGLTKYLATYWAKKGIRVNAISPSGVFNNQDSVFVERIIKSIPLGRMANKDEYKSSLIYLLSDASSYMTGFNLVVDGGRTSW